MTTEARKDQFVKGIHTLCDVYFSNHHDSQQTDIMGELLFNSRIFNKKASNDAMAKATTSMASCLFKTVNILKAIDSNYDLLNDTAVDEYTKTELDSSMTKHKKGKGVLHRLHYLTGTHKIAMVLSIVSFLS